MQADRRRSAAILAWPQSAEAAPEQLERPFRGVAVPAFPKRLWQEVALKRGWIDWQAHVAPMMAARRAALGDAAESAPRALVRVDELPHAQGFDAGGRHGVDAYRRFHAVLAEAGIPYLLAVSARVSRDYLDPTATETRPLEDREVELLHELRDDGVVFAIHGLDHRSRYRSPRRHSEFSGLGTAETEERLDAALATYAELGLETPIFVPPFNRFDAAQYPLLASRFEVVCGGPETVRMLGFLPTAWLGEALYLPSYRPLYGFAADAAKGLERLCRERSSLWAPLTLHWGWELLDDLAGLRSLCADAASETADWRDLLAATRAARALDETA